LISKFQKNLIFESHQHCFNYLTEHWDKKCKNENCYSNRKLTSLFPNRQDYINVNQKYGIYKFCENPDCNYKSISKRQMEKITLVIEWQRKVLNQCVIKTPKKWKKNIREGRFIPNVTNSWANSKCEVQLQRGDEVVKIKTRSSWEAYFQLFNTNLLYEKLIIPYQYLGDEFNYIVDFVDLKDWILYEIKPLSNKDNDKVKSKIYYAKKY
jgi:hypothetical protein